MARNIYCKGCNDRIKKSAEEFGELYESLAGTANKDLNCDGGGTDHQFDIKPGDICYAAVLLPSKDHPNYERQKPEMWAHDYITTAF